MPELPEVESVVRQLRPRLTGRRIERVDVVQQERFVDVELATGRFVEAVRRRGKYIIVPLDDGNELVMHLGMTGSFRFRGDPDGWAPDAYVRASFHLGVYPDGSAPDAARRPLADGGPHLHVGDDHHVLDFRDVRRFGRLTVVPAGEYRTVPTLHRLGPEPLTDEFDPGRFHRDLARTTAPVKVALLGQRIVAGVGNIYADEALWRARINPHARRVGRARANDLWRAIRDVLTEAIEREGTTFRDYQMVNGESGRNADFLVAYGQAGMPCPRCGDPLAKTVLGGRGTTYCRRCQR